MLATLGAGSCVDVRGGAVEAGWDLRYPDGRRTDADDNYIDCARSRLGRMALALTPSGGGDDPCAGQAYCEFGCSNLGFGTTEFAIPQGEYAIVLEVLDPAGKVLMPADGIVGPGAMVRQILTGEITSLSVNLIIVSR